MTVRAATRVIGGRLPRAALSGARSRWGALSALYALVAAVLTVRFMAVHSALSPIDEFTYVDAVDKARRGVVVVNGLKTDQYARQLAACRGVGTAPETVIYQGTCGPHVPDAQTFVNGFTPGDVHSPVYYFLTSWLSWPLEKLFGVELLTAGRLTSLVWLWAGMIACGVLVRRLGARWSLVAALPCLVVAMPVFRGTNAYITPDALNLLAGSLIALAAYLYARGEAGPLPLVVLGAVFGTVKLQNVFAVAAAALFLVIYHVVGAWGGARSGAEPRTRGVPDLAGRSLPTAVARLGGVLLVPLVFSVAWLAARPYLGHNDPARPTLDPPPSGSVTQYLYSLDDALMGVFAGIDGGTGAAAPWSVFPSFLLWGVLAAIIATAMFDVPTTTLGRCQAWAVLVSFVCIGPAMQMMFAVVFHAAVIVLPRYVMVLIPMMLVPTVERCQGTAARKTLVLLAVASVAYGILLPLTR